MGPHLWGAPFEWGWCNATLSPGSGDKGGIKAALDVTHQKSSGPEDRCRSYLLPLESLWNAWGHQEPALRIYQRCVGGGRKCSGEFFCQEWTVRSAGIHPLAFCVDSDIVVQLGTVHAGPVKCISIWPSPVPLHFQERFISRGSMRSSIVPAYSGFWCVTSWLPTTANGTVILLFLGLNSADLTVLSKSVFFFSSEIVTEHLAWIWAAEVIPKGNVEKKRCTPLYREVVPK